MQDLSDLKEMETWVSLRSREGFTGEREGRVELGLETQKHLLPCSEGRGNAGAKVQVCRATAKEQKGSQVYPGPRCALPGLRESGSMAFSSLWSFHIPAPLG